jgi:murein DD-endopeptidase MepM/ murein hydrolase activator NlpD
MVKYLKISAAGFVVLCSVLLMVLATIKSDAGPNRVVMHQEHLEPEVQTNNNKTYTATVKSGDTTGVILSRLGFPATEAANIIQAAKAVYPLKNIHIGHKFIRHDEDGLIRLIYKINANEQLVLQQTTKQAWTAKKEPRHTTSLINMVSATIEDSLFLDASKAGLADSLILKLVDMFAWDIDFARDLRKGDSFKVLFEESFDDEGKRVAYKILAATFTNRGRVFTGIRYTDQKGNVEYYDENGRNLRKTYLKSPVKYSRISSRFTRARKHPVLGYTRAHRSVDYAAKTGTPIHAVGDGKIVYKGRKGGYGRFIEIRHNNGIHSTAYAHMSRYAKGMRKGKYVKQGQIIGYVGMSGLATGPHLHFEFRSRGRAVNPLTVKHKAAKPVPKDELSAFRLKAKEMMRLMSMFDHQATWD